MRPLTLLTDSRPALSELDAPHAESWARERGLPAYRGRQLAAALDKRCVQELDELTEFPVSLRESLRAEYRLRSLQVRVHLTSQLDRSEKVLFGLKDGTTVEGYVFDRKSGPSLAESLVRVLPRTSNQRVMIPYSDIAALAFTGRDTAAGKSWEAWVKKYREKRAAGERRDCEFVRWPVDH